jgi:hypothetical protein
MSTLLLIPWIIFGYKHPSYRFIGLCQTRKTILILLSVEIVYWLVLVFLNTGNGSIAGEGSFAWKYILLYEKGIIPIWLLSENIDPTLGDSIDANFKFIYLLAALVMDYIFLLILSPRIPQLFGRKKRLPVENTRKVTKSGPSGTQTS